MEESTTTNGTVIDLDVFRALSCFWCGKRIEEREGEELSRLQRRGQQMMRDRGHRGRMWFHVADGEQHCDPDGGRDRVAEPRERLPGDAWFDALGYEQTLERRWDHRPAAVQPANVISIGAHR